MGRKILVCFSILVVVMMVAGCRRVAPFSYHPVSEVPEGPGLLTGEKGAVVFGGGGPNTSNQPEDRGADTEATGSRQTE